MEIPGKALEWLREGTSFLIVGHKGPDGDCLGSMKAFLELVRLMGGKGTLLLEKDPPPWFDFLAVTGAARVWEMDPVLPEAEILVLLDCSRFSRTGAPGKALEERGGRLLVLDHHAREGGFPASFEVVPHVDTSSAATALIVLDLYRALGKVPPPPAADGLLTGILTDTYWLQNNNTDERVLESLAFLMGKCAPTLTTFGVYDLVFRRYPKGTFRLVGNALSGTEIHGDGSSLALAKVRRAEIEKAGFRQFESELLTRPLLSLEKVRVAAVLYETEEGTVKFSLRSKGGGEALALARALGGGGHPEASGAEAAVSLGEARERLLRAWRSLG